jgi:WD40 repeat protein
MWDGDVFADRPIFVGRSLVLGYTKWAGDIQISPDGQWLAVVTANQVQLWDLDSWSIEWRRPLAANLNWRAWFGHDSSRLVCTNRTMPSQAWIVATGEPASGEVPAEAISLAAQSPASSKWALVGPESSSIRLWDPKRGEFAGELRGHTNTIQCLAFDRSGMLASGGNDRVIRVWDLDRKEERLALDGHTIGVVSLAIDESAALLASGGKEGAGKLWDCTRDPRGRTFRATASGEYLASWSFVAGSEAIAVLAGSRAEHELTIWNSGEGKILRQQRLALPNMVGIPHRSYGFSGDGGRVAGFIEGDPKAVHVWDVATGRTLRTARSDYPRTATPVLSQDGKRLAFSARSLGSTTEVNSARSEVVVIDVDRGEIVLRAETPAGQVITSLAIGTNYLATGRVNVVFRNGALTPGRVASIDLYNLESKHIERSIESNTGYVTAIAFSADGRTIAAATAENRLHAWRPETGASLFSPIECSTQLTSVTFSPDGGRMAATGFDSNVYLWDATLGGELLALRGFGPPGTGHYGFTARVHFSPDGKRLAANNWRGAINIWSIKD